MPTTDFSAGTVITSTWLNEIDDHVYGTGNPHGIPKVTSTWTNGCCLVSTTGVTLNTTDMAEGRAFTIFNNSDSTFDITQGSGVTLYNGGNGTSGTVTLGARALATIWCLSGTVAVIGGTKIT